MMKYIIISLFLFSSLYADIPEGYYDSVSTLSGEALKSALHDIIDNNTNTNYDATPTGSRGQMYAYFDNYTNTVRCVYTGLDVAHTYGDFSPPAEINCEHSYCQSWFEGIPEQAIAKADIHHLFPVQLTVNSSRGNNPLDNVSTISHTYNTDNNYYSYLGTNADGNTVFEPADQHKGNAARALLYFAVRYEMGLTQFDVDMLATLVNWHEADPADTQEQTRNDAIYDFQNNRNPFVDHPEYVDDIWGETPQDEIPPTIKNITFNSSSSITVNFSETVDETTSENTSNYSLSSIGNPTVAVRGVNSNNSKVTLSVPGLTQGTTYTLTVNNVEDLNNNIIDSNSLKDFQYLSKGAIAITGTNSDNPDDFAFVVLTDLLAGTEIRFTDSGWLNSNSFRGNEGAVKYLAPTDISSGTVITYLSDTNFSDDNDATVGTYGFALSTSGDQILAFQGASSSPSFLHAINYEGSAVWQTNATSSNTSTIPNGLTNTTNAVALQEYDNMIYNDVINFSSPSEALSSICDYTNWIGNDTTQYTFFYPNFPQNLTIIIDYPNVILNWDVVTEDTNGNPISTVSYKVYAGSTPDFPIDSNSLLETVSDNTYIHFNGLPEEKLFYKVTAVK